MKNYPLFILHVCANTCWGNAIDKIRSKRDVIKFLDRHFPDTVYRESQEWIFFHPDFPAAASLQLVAINNASLYLRCRQSATGGNK